MKKSLQKFTESETKIKNVLALKKIEKVDYQDFSESELVTFKSLISENLNNLKGDERDIFIDRIDNVLNIETKNQLWEINHLKITQSISSHINDYGAMPTIRDLIELTGLSRQSIHKHLKEYEKQPIFVDHLEQFRFMNTKLLAKVFQLANKGDIGACKLYFNLMGCLGNGIQSKGTTIQNQNNYIQINGIVINQETIQNLNVEQLATIETILKTATSQNLT